MAEGPQRGMRERWHGTNAQAFDSMSRWAPVESWRSGLADAAAQHGRLAAEARFQQDITSDNPDFDDEGLYWDAGHRRYWQLAEDYADEVGDSSWQGEPW